MPQLPGLGGSTRSYTAWSPAQRYFVEGDHVIQAEANRAIQFTGLDAGEEGLPLSRAATKGRCGPLMAQATAQQRGRRRGRC